MPPVLTLHVLPPSHPCRTVEAALRIKGLEAEIVAIVKLLIDAGARLDVTDKKGVALLKVAKSVEKEAGLSSRALTALLERAAKKK